MRKTYCPICGKELNIILTSDEVVDWNRPLKEHTCIVFCDNCKRKIKYSVEKKEICD